MFDPIFNGRKVRLAPPQHADRQAAARWTMDDIYMRLLDDDPVIPLDAESVRLGQSDDTSRYFHLRTLDDNTLIGFIALFNIRWASGSSVLALGIGEPDYRGKGYGSDALRLMLNYAFNELNLHRVGLSVIAYNAAAIQAYEAVGFVQEGVYRQYVLRQGQRHDMLLYSILRDEFLNSGEGSN